MVYLVENIVGDIVVVVLVGGLFGEGKLIYIMVVQFVGQCFGSCVDFVGVLYKMVVFVVEFDLFDFVFGGVGRYYSDKWQFQQVGEIGF